MGEEAGMEAAVPSAKGSSSKQWLRVGLGFALMTCGPKEIGWHCAAIKAKERLVTELGNNRILNRTLLELRCPRNPAAFCPNSTLFLLIPS